MEASLMGIKANESYDLYEAQYRHTLDRYMDFVSAVEWDMDKTGEGGVGKSRRES